MKLLVCLACFDWNALSYDPRECECGRTGGRYNNDGDTATVWGDGVLFGFSNRAWKPLLMEHLACATHPKSALPGSEVLWVYDESNGKITRLAEKPASWNRPANV